MNSEEGVKRVKSTFEGSEEGQVKRVTSEEGQVYISALTFQGNCFKVASGKRGDVPAVTY